MRKLRAFDKVDWDCWAGAERGKDGWLPLIGEIQFGSTTRHAPAAIIVDASGIGVYLEDGDQYLLSLPHNMSLGALIAEALPHLVSDSDLKGLGFICP